MKYDLENRTSMEETDEKTNFPIFSVPIVVKNNDGAENNGEKQVNLKR